MAGLEEILCSATGEVKYTSVDAGSQSWRQGNLQLALTKTGQYRCILNYKIGRPMSFPITNNVKKVSNIPTNPGRITLLLKDGANISLSKGDIQEVRQLINNLNEIKNAKSGRRIANGTHSFDLKSPTRSGNSNTPLQSSQNSLRKTPPSNGIRPLGNNTTNASSVKKLNRLSPPNGSSHVASRRQTMGFDEENDERHAYNGSVSSDEETSGGVSGLFVDEQDEQLDKENRTTGVEPRGVFQQRKKEGGNIFMQSVSEKQHLAEEKKAKTPALGIPNFYGSGSRGRDMVMASQAKLGGGAAISQRNSALKRPGYIEPTNTYSKKIRHLDAYDGWRNKTSVSKPNNISLHGFSNLGNTCYMNAILQSLFGLKSFTDDLLKPAVKQVMQGESRGVSLYWAVTSLLEAKQQRRSAEHIGNKLRLVKTAISATATRFSGFMQHDAHEFLCQCMDQLKEDVDAANKKLKDAAESVEAIAETLPCPVLRNFAFKVQHTIRCKECAKETTKTEEFYDLSVDMPRISTKSGFTASIQTALDQFFTPEEIEYSCSDEDCEGKTASVVHKFTKLPRIMILHLKRYTFDVEASVNAKLRQPIGIPKYLTLQWHCTNDTVSPVAVMKTNRIARTTPSSSFLASTGSYGDDDSNHGNIRKRLAFQTSPGSEKKQFTFKNKRPRHISDDDLEKDPFTMGSSSDEDTKIKKALAESKAEEEKRLQDEDALKKVLEDSKHDVGSGGDAQATLLDGEKDLSRMSEEEQLQYALALSRGDFPDVPKADANGNHKFTETTTSNPQNGWLVSRQDHDVWTNGIGNAANINGYDEPDGKFGQLEERQVADSGDTALTKLADYPQLGDLEQRLETESSRTGEVAETGDQSTQLDNVDTMINGGASAQEHCNGDSGFASPDVNGQFNDTGASGDHANNTDDPKLTANDSAIEMQPPSKCGGKTDFSNVIDLCGDEGSAEGKGTADASVSEGAATLSYAELKAKEEEEIRRATELSLQDCKSLEETEEAQIRRAQEMSLQEFNQSISMEDDTMDWEQSPVSEAKVKEVPMYTEEQLEALNANLENGNMPHSYRLVSVVNHIGTSSSAGHYVSDVYDAKKDSWFSYDDSDVQRIQESIVREERRKSGYIFFYAVNYE